MPHRLAYPALLYLYDLLVRSGIEVLYDDREERAGAKFTDADLIGLPLRVTVSGGTLAKGSIELKRRDRDQGSAELVPVADALAAIKRESQTLFNEIEARVVPVTL